MKHRMGKKPRSERAGSRGTRRGKTTRKQGRPAGQVSRLAKAMDPNWRMTQ